MRYRIKGLQDWQQIPPIVDLTKACMLATALLSLVTGKWSWIGIALAIRYFR